MIIIFAWSACWPRISRAECIAFVVVAHAGNGEGLPREHQQG